MTRTWKAQDSVDTSFGRIAVGQAGDGPALVLAHGWPWSSFSWHRLIPALSGHFTVYWFDMLGYGNSEMLADQTGLDVQARIFKELLNTWKLTSPLVVAHDMGGTVTLRAHLLHGCQYERLVLMNAVALSPWGSDFFDHVGRHADVFAKLPPHIHAAIVAAYIQGALVAELADGDLEKLTAPWLTPAGRESFYQQFAAADDRFTDEIFDRLGDVACPVTVLWGEADPWIPLERGRRLVQQLPSTTRLVTFEGVGHMPQLEAPDTATDAILDALSRPSGSGVA